MSDGTPTPASRRPEDEPVDGIVDDTPEQELAEDFESEPDAGAPLAEEPAYEAVPASGHASHGEAGTALTDSSVAPAEYPAGFDPVDGVDPAEEALAPTVETDAEPPVSDPPALEEPPVAAHEERDFSTAGTYPEPEPTPTALVPEAAAVAAPAAAAPAVAPAAPTVVADPNASRVVYVQPPVPPRKRGNRLFGALIALLSTVLFAALYAGLAILLLLIRVPADSVERSFLGFLGGSAFVVPIIFYAVFAILIALLINRGGWWAHVVGSVVVAVLVYVVSVGTLLLLSNVVGMAPSEARQALTAFLGQPILFAAAVAAREVALWTGLGISARGRRVTARNVEAREAFDREQAEAEQERDNAAF